MLPAFHSRQRVLLGDSQQFQCKVTKRILRAHGKGLGASQRERLALGTCSTIFMTLLQSKLPGLFLVPDATDTEVKKGEILKSYVTV